MLAKRKNAAQPLSSRESSNFYRFWDRRPRQFNEAFITIGRKSIILVRTKRNIATWIIRVPGSGNLEVGIGSYRFRSQEIKSSLYNSRPEVNPFRNRGFRILEAPLSGNQIDNL